MRTTTLRSPSCLALACLVAVEEGTLHLDEPAGEHGPEGVTVRHLLAHAGGYGFDTGVVQPPGRTRIYSNTGFDALADHLALRAGMPATRYVAAAVFEPLALAATARRRLYSFMLIPLIFAVYGSSKFASL